MRTYSNTFIHIPGLTKSDLEFISNSTTHEEVTLLAATCGMFIEKIHFYDPSTIPLHNQYEMKLVDTNVFEIAMFLDEIKAYETVYIGLRRISGNGAHLIHVSIRYNKEEYTSEEFEVDSIERDIILGVIQEVFLTILGKVIDDKNNKKDFRDNNPKINFSFSLYFTKILTNLKMGASVIKRIITLFLLQMMVLLGF